jgi:phospholipid-binding lipoprotein MlaA
MKLQSFNLYTIKHVCQFFFLAVIIYVPLASAQSLVTSETDPFIEINREVYKFNQSLDDFLFKPVTQTYDNFIPAPAKRGVSNFFNNLDDINVVLNDLLQLKLRNAVQDSGRFVINTTVGIVGLFDVASQFGLYKNHEDFGQTLGHWGVPAGPYLMLPILGTSNVRDAISIIPDTLMNPVFWIDDSETRFYIYTLDNTNTRLYYMAAESLIDGDEYSFVRDAYIQRREYLVSDGEVYDEWDEF